MQIFLDTANPEHIKHAWSTGAIDGVTTNPTLATRAGVPFKDAVQEIFKIVQGPISLEVIGEDYTTMITEAKALAALNDNVVVKIPMTVEGMRAVKLLTGEGIKTNVTLVFSTSQALLAAKAGATYISPFIGRLGDISQDGLELIAEIRQILDNYQFNAKLLAASIRTARQVTDVALLGADVATVPYDQFLKLFNHPLTDAGLARFKADWGKSAVEPLI